MKIQKLIYQNDKVLAEFDVNLDFIEGSNSKGYPTTIAVLPWMQFSPKGFDKEVNKVLKELVELWNEKNQ